MNEWLKINWAKDSTQEVRKRTIEETQRIQAKRRKWKDKNEINKMENNDTIKRTNKAKSMFLEKINKIYKIF